jgi:hypothetical protein
MWESREDQMTISGLHRQWTIIGYCNSRPMTLCMYFSFLRFAQRLLQPYGEEFEIRKAVATVKSVTTKIHIQIAIRR